MSENLEQLELLRKPFAAHHISKLPKPTRQQTDTVKQDYRKGIRCQVCGGWHHPDVIHLDYVGHAALTDRLLDVDPAWYWEPLSLDDRGLPALDNNGGMWIKLTIAGVTRMGYGDAQGKQGGDAIKECIGDALRNAAMRFGCALDLWHKGDLHKDDAHEPASETAEELELIAKLKQLLANEDAMMLFVFNKLYPELNISGAWDKGKVTKGKERYRRLVAEGQTQYSYWQETVFSYLAKNDDHGVREEMEGIDQDLKTYLWSQLNPEQRQIMKEIFK